MVVDLVVGGRGVFDVEVDGARVFSKHQLDRFPAVGEVATLVAAMPGAP